MGDRSRPLSGRALRSNVPRGDHHGLVLAVFGCKAEHHPSEDTFLTPTLPPAIKRFRGLRGTVPFNCADRILWECHATATHFD
jgi:hypothetical protein